MGEQIKKIKVAWICRVSDPDINDRLKPLKRTPQVSPWISHTANYLSDDPEIELHIISPHEYITGIKRFNRNGVYYYFFNNNIPIWGRHWPGIFKWDIMTNYVHNKRVVRKIIQAINPDVIHLQGAENPYYSITALQFLGKYPLVVNLQRMTLNFFRGYHKEAIKAVEVEKEILSKFKHFTIRTKKMKEDLLYFNPNAITYWVRYSIPELVPKSVKKEYDMVYFAQICKTKGIEDTIECLRILKSKFRKVTLCIMGSCNSTYKEYLLNIAEEKGVGDCILWKGFLPSLEEVHNEASRTKISVLPTYYDIIPGTIIESMQLGLPVVSYKAGSISELNEDRENVLLSEIGDIEGLANNIIRLLTDDDLYNTMRERGIDCIKNRYNNENVFQQHLDCYHQVIEDFRQSKGNICRQ
jgi:glycosyltransferase involved in cell wall biosynthesis